MRLHPCPGRAAGRRHLPTADGSGRHWASGWQTARVRRQAGGAAQGAARRPCAGMRPHCPRLAQPRPGAQVGARRGMRAGRRFSRRQGHGGRACPADPTDALPGGRTACPLRPRRQPWLDLICPPPPRAAWASRQRCSLSGRWPPLPPSSLGLPSTTRSARTRTSTCSTADPRGPEHV